MNKGNVSYDPVKNLYNLDGCLISGEIVNLWKQENVNQVFRLNSVNKGEIVVERLTESEKEMLALVNEYFKKP